MPFPNRVRALLCLTVASSCVSCGSNVVALAPRQPLPVALWECPARPPLPADDADDATFFVWVATVDQAGDGCRQALAVAREAVEGADATHR